MLGYEDLEMKRTGSKVYLVSKFRGKLIHVDLALRTFDFNCAAAFFV